jgi:hypothetical protein
MRLALLTLVATGTVCAHLGSSIVGKGTQAEGNV